MTHISYTLATANIAKTVPLGGINFEDSICYISFCMEQNLN